MNLVNDNLNGVNSALEKTLREIKKFVFDTKTEKILD